METVLRFYMKIHVLLMPATMRGLHDVERIQDPSYRCTNKHFMTAKLPVVVQQKEKLQYADIFFLSLMDNLKLQR